MTIRHTLHQLPPRMRGRSVAVDSAVQQFLQRIAQKTERGMVDRLSGGGAAGAYPVPRRTGNLARQTGHTIGRGEAVVFNAAPYARSVHEGFRAYGNPNAPYYGPRRYLEDAVTALDPLAEMQRVLERMP